MDLGAVERLVNAGIDFRVICNERYRSPLHVAANQGAVEIVRYLIGAGALLNRVDFQGRSALNLAVCSNKTEVAKVLIDAGAWLNQPDYWGLTALHYAVFTKQLTVLQALIQAGGGSEIDLNRADPWGYTPLYYALLVVDVDAVACLVEAGASINDVDASGKNLLDIAQHMLAQVPSRDEFLPVRNNINRIIELFTYNITSESESES